jgi:kinesin family protein 6/9
MVTSSRIKVFVRLRPSDTSSNGEGRGGSGIDIPPHLFGIDTISNTVTISATEGGGHGGGHGGYNPNSHNASLTPTTFQFEKILPPPTTNSSVYTLSALPLIRSSLAGFNATLLTYGQTGAGKTYTTFGPPAGASAYKERGLAARAIAGAFEEINRYKTVNEGMGGTPIEVRLSCIEIYNESVFDLLGFSGEDDSKDSGRDGGVPSLSLFESPSAGVQIRGLKMPLVNSAEEGLNLLFESQMNRAIAEHQLNDASSRSHCIFTFHFTVRNPENNKVTSSKFNIVDLAGSEKMVKTEAVGKVQRESNYINKSLSFLEQVVIALASKVRR